MLGKAKPSTGAILGNFNLCPVLFDPSRELLGGNTRGALRDG